MTDGGEGHRTGDDSERITTEPIDRPGTDRDGISRRESATEREGNSNSSKGSEADTPAPAHRVELGEPTAEKIARRRARDSSLEREDITAFTTDPRSLDASVQLQWGVRTTIGVVVLGLISGAVLGNFGVPPEIGAVVMGLFLVLGVFWIMLRYRAWVYQVREDSLYLERGVITNVRTIVPYVRIQHVDTSRGPFERALGLSTLVVYTAGTRGADVSVPGLQPEEARDLQQRLKKLAIEAEGDDAV